MNSRGRYHSLHSNNIFIIGELCIHIKMTQNFFPWKFKFDIDFDSEIKPILKDLKKITENQIFIFINLIRENSKILQLL